MQETSGYASGIVKRRFPRSEINQHLGIGFPSFCSEEWEICRQNVDRFIQLNVVLTKLF
jgi:hypothetical protein